VKKQLDLDSDACLFIDTKTNIYRCCFASLNINLLVDSFSVSTNVCAQVYIYPACLVSLCILCLDRSLKKTPPYLRRCQWHGSLNVCVVSPALCHTSQSVNFADLKRHLKKKKKRERERSWLLGYSTTFIKCDVYGISNKVLKW